MDHQLAYIDPKAKIGPNVTISPFTTVYGDVEIGEGTWVGPNVTLMGGTRIGKHCRIFPGAVIGAIPQDLKFDGEYTLARVGDHTTIRECVTINRGTKANDETVVGNHCLLMAYVHVAHDCIIGDRCVIANSVQLAGHVEVHDHAVIGGTSAVHQFNKIGAHAMVAGGTIVLKDVPPYVTAARSPLQFAGLNKTGLLRRGFTEDQLAQLREIYRIVFQSKMNLSHAIEEIENDLPATPEREIVLSFLRKSMGGRGLMRGHQGG